MSLAPVPGGNSDLTTSQLSPSVLGLRASGELPLQWGLRDPQPLSSPHCFLRLSPRSPQIYLVSRVDVSGSSPGLPHFLRYGRVWTFETQKPVNWSLRYLHSSVLSLRTAVCQAAPRWALGSRGAGGGRNTENSREGGTGGYFNMLSYHVLIRKQMQKVSVTCPRSSSGSETEPA